MLFHRSWNEDAEAQNENLQFHGTIMNYSNKTISGTGELSQGKWMSGGSPQISSSGVLVFRSQGVSLSEYIYKNM